MNLISLDNIKSLKASQLTELLLKLLHLEYSKYKFPDCKIYVPQNITTPDGGEDGRITTTNFKDSRWIKNTFCLFQSKATSMSKGDCKNEILNSKNDALKKQIKELFDKDGTYVLFTTDDYVQQNLQDRIDGFKEAIKSVEGEDYGNSAKIEIYDANLIRDWTNEYISAVSYVQACYGISKPFGLQIWNEFDTYQNDNFSFKSNSEIDSIINRIRNHVFNKKSIRIEGVSGIGKSRLICEALSPGEQDENGGYDVMRKSISDNVIYFDIGTHNAQNVLDFIKNVGTTYPAILVLDNCEPFFHEQFLKETQRKGSLINIVTIDYERWHNSSIEDCEIIELKSEYFKSVVEEILKENYSRLLSQKQLEHLIEFSEGNPKMAINFVKASLKDLNLGDSFDEELVQKLIFGRNNFNYDDFKILKQFSAFKYFEYPEDSYYYLNENHYNSLLEHIQFFSKISKTSEEVIRELILKYLRSGVLERRGNKIVIRPNPLSLKLALLFWNEIAPNKYIDFLNEVPETLKTSLTEQLQQLGSTGNAKRLVEKAWGVDGNFSTAEILNSNMGSRLFRSIVTVNPKATIKVLTRNYLDKPKEYLMSIVESRQNLVWALEKLCFREETFVESAKVLMCFAVAEIETYYSNNATDYFTQLFRIFLAGTEVDFDPRLKVLGWALEKQDPDFDALVIKTCQRAFTPTHNLHKIGGAEKQGGLLPLEDYKPKSAEEINKYREEIIAFLSIFISIKSPLQFSAQRTIYNNISNLFEFNYEIDKLEFVISDIIENIVDRDDLIKSLYSQASFIGLNEEERAFINRYIEQARTNSIEERILYNVSEPRIIIKNSKDENVYEDKGKRIAEKFAEDVVAEGIDIRPYFKNLLVGKQYNSLDFGKKLAELSGYNQHFIDDLISEVLKLENEQYNLSFLSGYISALEVDAKNEIFNIFINHKSSFAFNVFRLIEISFTNIEKLIDLIKYNDVSSSKLEIIKYDVTKLSPSDLLKYFKLIEKLENGHVFIIDTFSTLIWEVKNKNLTIDESMFNYIKSIIEEGNLLIDINKTTTVDFYSWQEIMTLLIAKFQEQICPIISNQIVRFYESLSIFTNGDPHIANIANMTLDVDFQNCWNIYAKLFLDKETFLFWKIFDMSFISGVTFNHPFFRNDERNNKLLSWLLKNKEVAPWIIRVAPLFDENGEDWFSFTETLINIFGKDKHFIDELSCNLHSMSTWGSRVPYLRSRLRLVEKLKDHKLKEIRDWALIEIEGYEKSIKIEEISDEEGFLGM